MNFGHSFSPGMSSSFLHTSDIEKFLKGVDHKTVSKEENQKLTEEVTEKEVHDFIKTLSPSKAPGTTGLNSGYFLEIWPYAGSLITRSINDCLETGSLPSKQREGVIVLIPKQDKDQRIIGNLRPITLLNCYYKIISGVLTNRMKPVLQKLIGNHQKAYLPGRYIGECTRTVYDIMNYAINNEIPSMAMLVDFKKAFDSVSHAGDLIVDGIVHDIIYSSCTLANVPSREVCFLVVANELLQDWLHSVGYDATDYLVVAVEEGDGPEVAYDPLILILLGDEHNHALSLLAGESA